MAKYFNIEALTTDGERYPRRWSDSDWADTDDVINSLLEQGWAQTGDMISIEQDEDD